MSGREAPLRERLRQDPADFRARCDLGVLLFGRGELEAARVEFERALRIRPDDAHLAVNLAAALLALGKAGDAVTLLRNAARRAPGEESVHYGLGCALSQAGDHGAAALAFRRAVELSPEHADAWYGLARSHHSRAEDEEALACFKKTLALAPDHPAARHMIAALTGETPDRPPDGLVARLFDGYAAGYETHVIDGLCYRAPELIERALADVGTPREPRVLDLGAGTGLLGRRLRSLAGHLTGVDASAGMLDLARARGGYDLLVQADLAEYLAGLAAESLEIVCAADVFGYVGPLEGVLAEVRRVLVPEGLLAFTVEEARGAAVRLARSGRFQHGAAYLEDLAGKLGMVPALVKKETLRVEDGEPCPGIVTVWRKGV